MSSLDRVVHALRALAAVGACAGLAAGCNPEAPRDTTVDASVAEVPEAGFTAPPPAPDVGESRPWNIGCRSPETSEKLPAREQTMRRGQPTSTTRVSTRELYRKFGVQCKACHVDGNQGGFQIPGVRAFVELDAANDGGLSIAEKIVERIRSDDPNLVMPPGAGRFSERPLTNDPLRELATMMEAWMAAGRPGTEGGFEARVEPVTDARFILDEDVGLDMTNLGNCIPGIEGFASESGRSAELDQLFAAANGLPEKLEETDLFTLDSRELARHGVVAFAPAYTLWADNAKKVRMVRVPRGKKIEFDEETQTFNIPPNTRFYKTFFKRVTDRYGNTERWRKLETRLIVARPDVPRDDDKSQMQPMALFGTYAWNERETEARLVRDPRRDNSAFADRLVTYAVDEHAIELLIEDGEPNPEKAARDNGFTRTYAIPGGDRCVHCHMGSLSRSFVLGFTPLQINRRPLGKSGVVEPAEADELNQLQRLIDYGVIGGMSSPEQVVRLEKSQGERKPRNDHELKAQGYMLGNCAHCHNPRGFPSSIAEELRRDVNFMPDTEGGGIFEFPLEKYSERIKRGPDQNVRIPYVTPSLYDLPRAYKLYTSTEGDYPPPKLQQCPSDAAIEATRADDHPLKGRATYSPELAPWRSLIYRNVDTPFSYSDDSAVFPHMPRDTPGFDCRAKRLLGNWMVSIPARFKTDLEQLRSDLARDVLSLPPRDQAVAATKFVAEYAKEVPAFSVDLHSEESDRIGGVSQNVREGATEYGINPYSYPEAFFEFEQPYEEVFSDDPEYLAAFSEAAWRLSVFENQGRSLACPDQDLDIVDPGVESAALRRVPKAEARDETVRRECTLNAGVVPDRAHWFSLDATEAPGEWRTRREDWCFVFTEDFSIPKKVEFEDVQKRNEISRESVCMITGKDPWLEKHDCKGVRPTEALRDFVLKPFPMGLWKKDKCAPEVFEQHEIRRASDPAFQGEARPRWMQHPATAPLLREDPDAPVYEIEPGAQIFTIICANCHGPQADSKGRVADTIIDMTGGDTRVANLIDGFFGPRGASASTNRRRVFGMGPDMGQGLTGDDWSARYLLWMASGGTQRYIPPAVLNTVGTSRVVDVRRAGMGGLGKSAGANMLTVAEYLCGHLILQNALDGNVQFDVAGGQLSERALHPSTVEQDGTREITFKPSTALIGSNGDYDLWFRLCSFDNPMPVRKVQIAKGDDGRYRFDLLSDTLVRERYPSDAPVGDHLGRVHRGIDDANLSPWCIIRDPRPEFLAALQNVFGEARPDDSGDPPYCPSDTQAQTPNDNRLWAKRGSLNVGLSVFFYLDQLAGQRVSAPVLYDACDKLGDRP